MRLSLNDAPTSHGLSGCPDVAASRVPRQPIVWDWLWRQSRSGDRPFILQDLRTWSFAEVEERVERTVGWLLGTFPELEPGDRVAVLMPPGFMWVQLVFGLLRLRVILVPVNLRLSPDEVGKILRDADPRVLLTTADLDGLLSQAPRGIKTVLLDADTGFERAMEAEPVWDGMDLDPEQIQSLMYTSGTSGMVKAAEVRLRQHWWNAVGSAMRLGHAPDDTWLLCMPVFHVGGQAILFRAAMAGIPVRILDRFDSETVSKWLTSDEISLVSLVPTMLERILLSDPGTFSPRIRAVLLGGAATSPDLLRRAWDRGLPVMTTYGMTETASQMATRGPQDGRDHPASVGRALMGVELAVEKPDGRISPIGEGEIVVRGPQVIDRYWRQPDMNRTRFSGGWFHTGDQGVLNEEGWLTVLDRRLDLVVTGGENVWPAEVEVCLEQHPRVAEAAVVGVADVEWGQIPVAYVVLKGDPPDEAALTQWCREYLAHYKVPRRWIFTERLPRTASGKLRRQVLRERAAEDLLRERSL